MCLYVYDISCDALVYCYACDEIGNGSPVWAPDSLKKVISKPVDNKYVELKEDSKKENKSKKSVTIQE